MQKLCQTTFWCIKALMQMYGDLLFTAPADKTAKIIAAHSDAPPLYHYIYNH